MKRVWHLEYRVPGALGDWHTTNKRKAMDILNRAFEDISVIHKTKRSTLMRGRHKKSGEYAHNISLEHKAVF